MYKILLKALYFNFYLIIQRICAKKKARFDLLQNYFIITI